MFNVQLFIKVEAPLPSQVVYVRGYFRLLSFLTELLYCIVIRMKKDSYKRQKMDLHHFLNAEKFIEGFYRALIRKEGCRSPALLI